MSSHTEQKAGLSHCGSVGGLRTGCARERDPLSEHEQEKPGRTLVLFTRAPQAEARAKRLPVAAGARLFGAFLQSWRERAAQAGAALVAAAPSSSMAPLRKLLPGARVVEQQGDSFGSRVESAFSQAFDCGASSVLMVSGDSPPLQLEELHQAFAHLESHRRSMVLAPTEDGGVNAIGLSREAQAPLAHIRWLTADVYGQLLAVAQEQGLALRISVPGHDLDCAQNLRALYRLSRNDPHWRPFRWLLRSLSTAPPRAELRTPRGRILILTGSRITRGPPANLL